VADDSPASRAPDVRETGPTADDAAQSTAADASAPDAATSVAQADADDVLREAIAALLRDLLRVT
jgi:hypothetical protein